MNGQNDLKFDSIFKTLRSEGAEKAIEKAGVDPKACIDPQLCGLVAFAYYARAENGNNYLEIGNRWFEHGKALQATGVALMLCAEYYKKLTIENVPKDEISSLLDEAKDLEPQNPLVLELCVEHYYKDGDEQGFKLLKKITDDWPDYASAWFLLGSYCLKDGNYQISIDAYENAVSLRPDLTSAWNMLGIVYSRYAIALMSRARLEYATRQQLRARNGEIVEEENDEELNEAKEFRKTLLGRSKQAYDGALQLEPDNAYALASSGLVEHELGNSQEAYSRIQKALSLDPKIRDMSDFENILEELRQEVMVASMSDAERVLIKRARGYEIDDKQCYKSQDKKFQPWHDIVDMHFKEHLLSEMKARKEMFIEYWPVYLFWGVGETHKQTRDRIYRHKLGNYGSGYLCLTNSAVYLTVIQSISKSFPAILDGLVFKFMSAAAGDMDSRNLYEETETWRITFEEILGSQIGTDDDGQRVIILHTSSGQDWHIQNFFEGTLEEMQTGLAMAKSGKLLKYFSKETDETEEMLSKLEALKNAGVLSEQEFEDKKRKILKGV